MSLKDLTQYWVDTPEHHSEVATMLTEYVNNNDTLNAHRTWIEATAHGFGERCFWALWDLLLDELGNNPALLEVGVYKGATLSVWRLIRPDGHIFGITPLDSSDGHLELDYLAEIKRIHAEFGLLMPHILHGRSDDAGVVAKAEAILYDVVYIDGSHVFEDVQFDLHTYSPMVKKGGYLVIDDANCDYSMPFGFFTGIQSVTDAKIAWLSTSPPFEFVCSVVHLAIYRRV